jgi:hypothetical protein
MATIFHPDFMSLNKVYLQNSENELAPVSKNKQLRKLLTLNKIHPDVNPHNHFQPHTFNITINMFATLQVVLTFFAIWSLFTNMALGDTCYYPNGDLVTQEPVGQCGGNNVCCPLNWVCISNGLCFDPATDYYGRYSCADKSWTGCPTYCTTSMYISLVHHNHQAYDS